MDMNHGNSRRATPDEQWDPVDSVAPMDIGDFHAYLPDHKYVHMVTRQLWPAAAVDASVPWPQINGKAMRPSAFLDKNKSVQQMTWHPDHGEIIKDKLVYEGGWVDRLGARTFNLYRPPDIMNGDARNAARWRDHLRCIYPDDADHIERWLAQRVQYPGVKINHALMLGGEQGIGKDSLLEPVKLGVGPWNFKEVTPQQMLGRFNPWVRAVILRISEGRDLGEINRFAFYDHSKIYIAAPPDTIMCDEKNTHEHPVFNLMGIILTSNYKTSGIYLPPDDRRHFVAWSESTKDEFDAEYWPRYWDWLAGGGAENVVAYLRGLDLSSFDPKAPPPKTEAWHCIVHSNIAPEDADISELISDLGHPVVLVLNQLIEAAKLRNREEIIWDLTDRGKRRAVPHKLERAGYSIVRNPDAQDGLWKVERRRVVIYGHRDKSRNELITEARRLAVGQSGQ